MEDNIIKTQSTTIIMNGGNGLKDCPTDWDKAREWEKNANCGIEYEDYDQEMKPLWKWDCGFKLDYDGGLMSVSIRFYPPKSNYGETWDGTVTVYIFDKEVEEKKFDCETLEELKRAVEEYVNGLRSKIEAMF